MKRPNSGRCASLRSVSILLFVLLVLLRPQHTSSTRCDPDIDPVVHLDGDITPSSPLVVALSPAQLLADNAALLDVTLRANPAAAFFFSPTALHATANAPGEADVDSLPSPDMTRVEQLVQRLLRNGNWVGIDLTTAHSADIDVSTTDDSAIRMPLRTMADVLETVAGVPPLLVLPPSQPPDNDATEAIATRGFFPVVINEVYRDPAAIRASVMASDNHSTPHVYPSLERTLSPTQRRCAFARLECDSVAPRELLYPTCSALRRAHMEWSEVDSSGTEHVDLFKFAARTANDDRTTSQLLGEEQTKPIQAFREGNKVRIEIAYRAIARGSSLGDILKTLLTISEETIEQGDQAVADDLADSAAVELHNKERYLGLFLGVLAMAYGLWPALVTIVNHGQSIAQQRGRSAMSRAVDIGKSL